MVDYKDKSYWDKRKELRAFYDSEPVAHKAVKTLAFDVITKLPNPIIKDLLDFDMIIKFLIDGYLAFEIIDKYSVQEIDPTSLVLTEVNGKFMWQQWAWKDVVAEIDMNKMIYISYYKTDTVSFLSSIYEGLIDPNDDDFIKQHTNYIVNCLSDNTLNIEKVLKYDKQVKRGLKINKILSG